MNKFLSNLLERIAIDVPHLHSYLSSNELQYLDGNLRSQADYDSGIYTGQEGQNLEVLLQLLTCHKQDIDQLRHSPSNRILVTLYTSSVISGNYDCFRFDLDKFDQTYNSTGKKLTIYRVGRKGEGCNNLGNSWAMSHCGIQNYTQSSSIDASKRPVYEAEIDDSEILIEISSQENELILKKNFKLNRCRELSKNEKQQIFM